MVEPDDLQIEIRARTLAFESGERVGGRRVVHDHDLESVVRERLGFERRDERAHAVRAFVRRDGDGDDGACRIEVGQVVTAVGVDGHSVSRDPPAPDAPVPMLPMSRGPSNQELPCDVMRARCPRCSW